MKLRHFVIIASAIVSLPSCKPTGPSAQERQKELLEEVKLLSHDIASTKYSVEGGWTKLDPLKQADYQDALARFDRAKVAAREAGAEPARIEASAEEGKADGVKVAAMIYDGIDPKVFSK